MHHTLDAKMRILMLSLLELFQEGKNMLWQLFYNREDGKNSFRIVTWRWFHTRTKEVRRFDACFKSWIKTPNLVVTISKSIFCLFLA